MHMTGQPSFAMMLVTLVVMIVGVAHAGSPPVADKDGADLEALCRNKTINLTRMSQLDSLVGLEFHPNGECLANTEAALRGLKAVIDANKRNECSLRSYVFIRNILTLCERRYERKMCYCLL